MIKVCQIGKEIVGFVCFRERTRSPATVIYFLGTHPDHRTLGVGTALLDSLGEGVQGLIEIKVVKDNPALQWWENRGFEIIEDTFKERNGWLMHKKSPNYQNS